MERFCRWLRLMMGGFNRLNRPIKPPRLVFERLEPRLMLSADIAAGAVGPELLSPISKHLDLDDPQIINQIIASFAVADSAEPRPSSADPPVLDLDALSGYIGSDEPISADSPSSFLDQLSEWVIAEQDNADLRTEIIFVDEATPDYETLLSGISDPHDQTVYQIVLLKAEADGLDQITQFLTSQKDIDAIHLISHGTEGQIQLGQATLNLSTLTVYDDVIASWASALSSEADVLIYGCNLTGSVDGQNLVAALAELTGADIAASDDRTGATGLHADWDLEYRIGEVETDIAVNSQTQSQWQNTLVLAYESFNYAGGSSLSNQNGGIGWASAWSDEGTKTTVSSTGMEHPQQQLLVSNGSLDFSVPVLSSVTQERDITTTLGTASTTAWVSFLVEPDETGIFDYAGVSFGDSGTDQIWVGYGNTQFAINKHLGSEPVYVPTVTATPGQTYFLVAELEFTAGKDTVTLYVDPTPGESTPDSVYSATKSNRDLGTFTEFILANGTGTNNASIDELRIGTSFAEVAPAPYALDEFNAVSYAGDDGGLSWSNNWQEIGESDGVSKGEIRVTSHLGEQALRIEKDGRGASREVDLSGAYTATLSFDYARENMEADDGIHVEVSKNGSTWEEVDYIDGPGTDGSFQSVSYNISSYIDNDTEIRFIASSMDDSDDHFYVDNVRVDLGFVQTLTVNTVSDVDDGTTTSVDALIANPGGDGKISLREAIIAANATSGPDIIKFEIVGDGPHTITLSTAEGALPSITDVIAIDGTSESGYINAPIIEIDGSVLSAQAGDAYNGLHLDAGSSGSTIQGLSITGFTDVGFGEAIDIDSANNTIVGNYIGVEPDGTTTAANRVGISISNVSGNIIGGVNASDINHIIGGEQGVQASGATNDTVVLQNKIYGQSGLGIDLGTTGVTPNSTSDDWLDYPVISSLVQNGADVDVAFDMDVPAGDYRIEFFENPAGLNPSNYGGGEEFLGAVTITSTGSGPQTFNERLSGVTVSNTAAVVATATEDLGGGSYSSTSEFSTFNTGNAIPTFTAFVGVVDTTNEDVEVEIAFSDLIASGNESDSDGTVDAFIVKSVSTGSLKIGTSAGSATVWVSGSNDTIDATYKGYWTPDNDANGLLNAFSVVAKDDGGAHSTTHVVAQISTLAVNDDPSGTGSLSATSFNDNAGAANVLSSLTLADPDAGENDLTVRITVSDPAAGTFGGGGFIDQGGGVYTLSGLTVAQVNAALDAFQFTPANNTGSSGNFTTDFTVEADDQGGAGYQSVLSPATMTINRINDQPVLGNNSLTVNQGDSITLGSSNFSATDIDDSDSGLTFTITSLNHGLFYLISDLSTPITSFTQAQVLASQVRFVHDAGEIVPSYEVSVSDGALSSAQAAANISYAGAADGVLWLSGHNNVSSSNGVPGLDLSGWDQDDILQQANPGLGFGEGATGGTFSTAFDTSNFSNKAQINGLHYVTNNIVIGNTNAIALQPGDLLLTTESGSTLTSNGSAPPANLSVDSSEIFYFRPDQLGDYSQGNFYPLIDLVASGSDVTAISLIEIDVAIGDYPLDKGDIVFSVKDGSEENDIWIFDTSNIDPQNDATYPSALKLIEGSDPNVDIDDDIFGLDVLENSFSFGMQSYDAGSILITTKKDDTDGIGTTAKTAELNDIVALAVTQTTLGSGAGNAQVQASLIFDGNHSSGNDVNFDTGKEHLDGLSLTATVVNTTPTLGNNAFSISEGHTATVTSTMLSATDDEKLDSALVFNISNINGGQFERASNLGNPITSFVQSEVTASQVIFVDDGDESAPSFDISVSDGELSTTPASASIVFSNVNDAPVLNAAVSPVLSAIDEDNLTSIGDSIASIVIDGSITDADGASV